jgi:transcription initiation factor IIE alpha subunit
MDILDVAEQAAPDYAHFIFNFKESKDAEDVNLMDRLGQVKKVSRRLLYELYDQQPVERCCNRLVNWKPLKRQLKES